MSTIENLNFKLVVDDKEFDEKIKSCTQSAKDFNTEVSNLLNVYKQLNETRGKATSISKIEHQEMVEFTKSIGKRSDAIKSLNSFYKEQEKESTLIAKEEAEERKRIAKEEAEESKRISNQVSEYAKSIGKKSDIQNQMSAFYKEQEKESIRIAKEESDIIRQLKKEDAEYAKKVLESQIRHKKEQSKESERISKRVAEYANSIGVKSDIQKQMSAFYKQMEKDANASFKAQQKEAKDLERAIQKAAKEMERAEKQAYREAERAAKKAAREAIRAHKEEVAELNNKYRHYNSLRKELTFQSSLFRQLKTLALTYFSVQAVRGFISELVRVSSEFEKQKVALGAIINDTIQAEGLFNKLQSLAIKSPFNFSELSSYLKQLSAFSIPTDELYETTKMLADVSAGLGIDLGRIVLAYGQVASAEFLRGQEIRQFTEAGLPILKELAKQFSVIYDRAVSVGEVFDLVSKRKVPFEMVKQVFIDLTSEGGKFYKMQEVLADTLSGKLANLKDSYQLMLYEIGQGNSGIISSAVEMLRKLTENWEDVGRALSVVITAFGVYKALQIVNVIQSEAAALRALQMAISQAEAAQLGLNVATKKNPIGLIITLLAAAGVAVYQYISKLNELTGAEKRASEANAMFTRETTKLKVEAKTLLDSMQELTVGTEEYEQKRKQLLVNYGEYLSAVDVENTKIGNLTNVYNSLSSAIDKSVSARVSAYASENAIAKFAEEERKIFDELQGYFNDYNINPEAQSQLRRFVTDWKMNYEDLEINTLNEIARTPRINVYDDNFARLQVAYKNRLNEFYGELAKIKERWGDVIATNGNDDNTFVGDIVETTNSTIDTEIERIKNLIELFRQFKSYVKELESVGYGNPRGILTEIFPQYAGKINFQDYDQEIQQLLYELESLGEKGVETANALRYAMQQEIFRSKIDELKEFTLNEKKLAEETEKLMEKLEKFKVTSMLSGVGIEFDVTKAVKDYQDAIKKINAEVEDLRADSAKLEGSVTIDFDVITSEQSKQTENEWTKLIDKLSEIGKKGFKEMYKSLGVPDRELSKMNPFQLSKYSKELERLKNKTQLEFSKLDIFKGLEEDLLKTLSSDQVKEALKAIKDAFSKSVSEEETQVDAIKKQKTLDRIKMVSGYTSQLADLMSEYADASDNDGMKVAAALLDTASQIAAAFSDDVIKGILQTAFIGITTIFQELTYTAKLEKAIREARREAQLLKWEMQMEDVETVFGTNQVKQMQEAVDVMGQIQRKYAEIYSDLNAKGGIYGYMVNFNDRGGLANLLGFKDQYMSFKDLVEGLGYEMYDKYGNLNADALQAILDTYDRLSSADRAWMEEALGYSEEYEKAMEQIDEVLQDLYGQYVGDVVDTMIDKWIQLGIVTTDYADALSDVAKNYAKMAIQSAILENVFTDDFEKQLREATINMDAQKVMKLFTQAQSQIEDMAPFIAQILESLDQYFVSESSSDSLSSGIKSITEETASLLASYVNAIRADVSVTRNNVGVISTDLKLLLGMLPSAPSLAEYLTQIQANTYNTQVATESILGELRGVIGTETGMTAVRVSM